MGVVSRPGRAGRGGFRGPVKFAGKLLLAGSVLTNVFAGRYEGEYVDSMQTGYGLMTWADGRRYEGYWVNSKCTGFGTLTHKDGRRYEGKYVNDKMQVRKTRPTGLASDVMAARGLSGPPP